MILHNAIALFLREQTIRGNSESTVNYYKNTLILFEMFLGDHFNVSEMNLSHFNDYKLFLLSGTMNRVSINTNLRSVKAFLRYLAEQQHTADFTNKLCLIKAHKNFKLPLTDDEIKILLGSFNDDMYGLRDICIVLLMLDSGLRRNEIVKLNYNDLDLKDSFLVVLGKGNKIRYVPFGSLTLNYIKKYLTQWDIMGGALFSLIGGERITNNTIKMIFQRLKTKTGIKRISAHLLRHTFATRYILNGGNLETLRILLGHSSVSVTQVYLHLATTHKILHNQYISLTDILIL